MNVRAIASLGKIENKADRGRFFSGTCEGEDIFKDSVLSCGVMLKNRDRLLRFVLLVVVVALALVLYPYFVNLMPVPAWLKSLSPIWVAFGALVFAVILVVAQELLNLDKLSEDKLREDFWRENNRLIQDRCKQALDRHNHIVLSREDTPEDMGRSPRKSPEKKKSWFSLFSRPKQVELTGRERKNRFWRLDTRREVEDLPTGERTPLTANKPILEVFEAAKRRLLIVTFSPVNLSGLTGALKETGLNPPSR